MGKRRDYDNFPISLALFDAVPVILFSIAMIIIAVNYNNWIFITGAALCTFAGLGKVMWKIIIAATKKDIVILNRQLRFVMPLGFLCIITGLITGMDKAGWVLLWRNITTFPQIILFIITFAGMVMMGVFAKKLDPAKTKSNWIEQITNAVAQGCLLIGVLLCL